MLTPKRS